MQNNTHFIGVIKNMSKLYPVADTLIHPTLGETYGMVVLEAMSHRLPVIVSSAKYCGFSEHLDSYEAIILNNPTDSQEISMSIQTLTNQLELRNKISENGFKKSQAIKKAELELVKLEKKIRQLEIEKEALKFEEGEKAKDRIKAIEKELAELKEEYETETMRVVFKDSSFKDAVVKTFSKKGEEICEELGVSPTNFWQIIHRAKLQLRECVDTNWFKGN